MKYIKIFLLFILTANFLTAQTPESHFLYLYDWGEGGITYINIKVDQIRSIDRVEDGYIFMLGAFCIEGENACIKYQKIDFSGNEEWTYEFNAVDTAFIGSTGAQKNWVIDNKLYTLGRFYLGPDYEEVAIQYAVFDMELGDLEIKKQYLSEDIGLKGLGYFYPYQDSLFIFGQSHEVENGRNVPAFRVINRQGEIIRSVNANSYFQKNNTFTTNFKENSQGTFNIITVQRDYFDTSAGFLYAGTCSVNGNKLGHYPTGDHTLGGSPREITFKNGNRFLVANIDTAWNDIFDETNIFKTYYLNPIGQVLKESLYDLGDTTYEATDVMLCENGDALIVGNARTPFNIFDNRANIFLIRIDSLGNTIWHKKYNPYLFDNTSENSIQVVQLKEDWDNGILITGNISRLTDTITGDQERYGYILKLDQNGCYGTDCDGGDILLDNKAPVFITPLPSVEVYPNPTDTYFTLEVSTLSSYSWSLYNALGHEVKHGHGKGDLPLTITTEQIPPGIYFLRVQLEEGFTTKQIIISR